MPRRHTEIKKVSSSRYSSVTLPRDFCFFLDKVIINAGREEAKQQDSVPNLPSRRMIVQDAVELYIEQLFPDLHDEYVKMCKDAGMYQKLRVHQRWNIEQELLKARAKEVYE